MTITIQPVTTIEQCHHVNTIEHAAWGSTSHMPDHLMITVARHHGVVLIAYDDDFPVGFCLSFVSFVDGAAGRHLKHHSHMAGVIPAYQGKGIGEQIKLKQRDHVLQQGIDLMTWTFDPLETRNGRLNLHKLGAVCNTYKRNVYGMMNDAINAGILTDRFQVDWWLDSTHVEQHKSAEFAYRSRSEWESEGVKLVNSAETTNAHPYPQSDNLALFERENKLLLAVPSNFQAVKRADLQNAIAWRTHTRKLFEAAFAQNFTATDLIYEPHLSYYLLEKNWQPQ